MGRVGEAKREEAKTEWDSKTGNESVRRGEEGSRKEGNATESLKRGTRGLTRENLEERAKTCVTHPASAPAMSSHLGSNPPRGRKPVS